MNNKALAVIVGSLLLFTFFTYTAYGQVQESFTLQGNHTEDTVSETAEALG